MIEYLLLLLPVFLAVLMFRRHAGVYLAAVLYVTLIAGLRLDVGYDYPAYVDIYKLAVEPDLEFLSDLLMQAARALGHSQYFFLLTSALIIGGVALAFWRYTRDPLLALWVFLCMPYMFLVSLSIVRQYSALAMGFLVLSFYQPLGLWRVLPLLACAGLLHASAFVLLPFALVWRLLERPLPGWLMLASLPLLYGLSSVVRAIATAIVPFSEVYLGEGDNGFKLYVLYVLILSLLVIFRRRAGLNGDAQRYLNLFYVGVALFSLTVGLSEAAARISYYFLVFAAPLLGHYIGLFRPRALARALLMSLLFLLFFLQLYIASRNPVTDPNIPYRINTDFLENIL